MIPRFNCSARQPASLPGPVTAVYREKKCLRSRLLHGVVRLPVLHVLALLALLLGLVLDVVALVDAAQHQVVQNVLARLLQQLLEQPQGHDTDLHIGWNGLLFGLHQ